MKATVVKLKAQWGGRTEVEINMNKVKWCQRILCVLINYKREEVSADPQSAEMCGSSSAHRCSVSTCTEKGIFTYPLGIKDQGLVTSFVS